ncbi:dynamin family protein [Falsibacillus albus]|uniref:dynamin family protein n=1 Tax=Falsibacillus albus TaxID=2478915 RepID=UPI0013146180|nr:dynamin family protein [Falsibacillus albus]
MADFKTTQFKRIFEEANTDKMIALFGKSQVGKTTLILSLIGLKEEHVEAVSTALRGGRKRGSSSTSTAMKYSFSEDEDYHIRYEDTAVMLSSEEALMETLAHIRDQVEKGIGIDLVEVLLPSNYRDPKVDAIDLSIIDLPGIESSSEEEHRHVNRIINQILPKASLILMVERADQLSRCENFFDRIDSDFLKDWMLNPQLFRLVLTHAVSPASTEKKIYAEQQVTPEWFIDLYKKELHHSISNWPGEVKLYPVDMGDSWEKTESDIKGKTESLIRNVLTDLIHDLNNTEHKFNSLIIGSRMFQMMNKTIKHKTNMFNQELASLKKRADMLTDYIQDQEYAIKKLEEEIAVLDKQRKVLKMLLRKYEANQNLLHYQEVTDTGERKPSAIYTKVLGLNADNSYFELIQKQYDGLIKHVQEDLKDTGTTLNLPPFPSVRIQEELVTTLSFLQRKVIDYFFQRNWKKAINKVNIGLKKVTEGLNCELSQSISEEIEANTQRLHQKRTSLKNYVSSLNDELLSIQKKVKDVQLKRLVLVIEKEAFMKRSKDDLELSQQFLNYITAAFDKEYSLYIGYINSDEKSQTDKFYYLMNLQKLTQDYKKLVMVNDNTL